MSHQEEDSQSGDKNKSQTSNLPFDQIEEAIGVVQSDIEEAEDTVGDAFAADVDDLEDRVHQIREAVDDAQDGEGSNPLGVVPAYLDYAQALSGIIKDETDTDALNRIVTGLEDVEEYFQGITIAQTKWYSDVNGIPDIHNTQEVSPTNLKHQGDIDGNPNDYTLYGLPTRSADIDESVVTIPPNDNDPIDLNEVRHFKTEKEHGGVV